MSPSVNKAPGSAIVLVVDRLGAGYLGPYGNTWLETPHFNRLAAESLVCETVLADSPDLDAALRAYWTGRHALEPVSDSTVSLAARAKQHGARTLLVTDEDFVAEHALAAAFSERVFVESPAMSRGVEQIERSAFFRLIAAALEAIAQSSGPLLAWIHSRGMAAAWDAPREFRERLADPEDPSPPDFVVPPERRLERNADPDEVLGVIQAYAGQVQLVDECLGMLWEAIAERPQRDQTLFAMTSPRGYPLGEHGRIGPCDHAFYGELLQVPLIIQLPGGEGRLMRTQRLVQGCDLMPTIIDACGWGDCGPAGYSSSLLREVRSDQQGRRTMACAAGQGQRAIRTSAWLLREWRQQEELRRELFAKPDDRWEANEVSSRCEDITALLAESLDRFEQAARDDKLAELAPPPEILQDVWR